MTAEFHDVETEGICFGKAGVFLLTRFFPHSALLLAMLLMPAATMINSVTPAIRKVHAVLSLGSTD